MAEPVQGETVAIVGAGIAGICLALDLKAQGVRDFVVYEREDGAGGTWYQNAYPGCRCDVAAIHYSHSRYPNPDWTETHPPRQEILSYWERIVKDQGLTPHLRLDHNLLSATWNSKTFSYECVLGSPSGDTRNVSHRYLVSAIGGFSKPRWPKIEGLEDFRGGVVHSARWPKDLKVEQMIGKTVAVVGNGCSGVQLVAELAKHTNIKVIALARSHQWLLPGRTLQGPETRKFGRFERYIRSFRSILYILRLLSYVSQEVAWGAFEKKSWIRPILQWHTARWMRKHAPPALKDKIVPPWSIGGKRVVIDCGYLCALNKPNVTALWDGIEETTHTSIVTSTGKRLETDYLILATGFELSNALEVTGREGVLSGDRERLQYYHGCSLPGFPNYFTMMGNNVHPVHLSQVYMLEVTSGYISQIIAHSIGAGLKSLEARPQATKAYTDWLDKRTRNTVFQEAHSYFRSEDGTGRAYVTWPGPGYLFWWHNAWPVWRDYLGAENLVKAERTASRKRNALIWVVVLAVLWKYRTRLRRSYRRWAL